MAQNIDQVAIDQYHCDGCGSTDLVSSEGFIVCRQCGTVKEKDFKTDLNTFTMYQKMESLHGTDHYIDPGPRVHILMSGSQTLIGHDTWLAPADKKRMSMVQVSKAYRLKRTQDRMISHSQEYLNQCLKSIFQVSRILDIPEQTRERAAFILRRVLQSHFPKFFLKTAMILSCILFAIREHKIPIMQKELIQLMPYSNRYFRHRVASMNKAKLLIVRVLNVEWPRLNPEDYVGRIINFLRQDKRVMKRFQRRNISSDYFTMLERTTFNILKSMSFEDYGSKFPHCVAASMVYAIDSLFLRITSLAVLAASIDVHTHTINDQWRFLWKEKLQHIREQVEEIERSFGGNQFKMKPLDTIEQNGRESSSKSTLRTNHSLIYTRYSEKKQSTHDISLEFGIPEFTIYSIVRIYESTIPEIRELMDQGKITFSHARCVASLSPKEQESMAEILKTSILSVKELEKLLREIRKQGTR